MNVSPICIRSLFAGLSLLSLGLALNLAAKDLAPYDSDRLFDPARLVRIDLQVAPADWETLSKQHRSLIKTLRTDVEPSVKEDFFDYFRAELTVDGVKVGPVAIRKKGFVGSMSRERPSLKIQLDKYDKEARFAGLSTLTLNNNQQDPSTLHQVIGYQVFHEAGLPAARCNLAVVTVNGQSLGLYSNVESVDKAFFQRRFHGDKGTLWEGTICDFTENEVKRFDRKFGPHGATARLEAVVAALKLPDAEVIPALEQVLDVDAFLRFWATEVLLGHWDGYASNRNNFFVYHHAGKDRLIFLPWGLDQLASDVNRLWGDPTFVPPKSVKAASELTLRLYNLPAGRARYVATMRALLKEAWNEDKLRQSIKALKTLTADVPKPPPSPTGMGGSLDGFIVQRRAGIEAELAKAPPEWTLARRKPIDDIDQTGELDVEFSVTPPAGGPGELASVSGSAQVKLTFNKRTIAFVDPQFKLARTNTPWGGARWTLIIGRPETDPKQPTAIEISFSMRGQPAGADSEPLRVDVFASPASARLLEPVSAGQIPEGLAAVGGHLKLLQMETTPGGVIKGHLTGELFTARKAPKAK